MKSEDGRLVPPLFAKIFNFAMLYRRGAANKPDNWSKSDRAAIRINRITHAMASKTAIIYATVDGHTLKICEKLKAVLGTRGHAVEIIPVGAWGHELSGYNKVVVASSIRYGKHDQRVVQFIHRHAEALNAMKAAFISVNLVARKAEKNEPHTNPYVKKFLASIPWRPTAVGVFAGKLDYPHYAFFDRLMIQLIMMITKGPTDPKTVIEYTD